MEPHEGRKYCIQEYFVTQDNQNYKTLRVFVPLLEIKKTVTSLRVSIKNKYLAKFLAENKRFPHFLKTEFFLDNYNCHLMKNNLTIPITLIICKYNKNVFSIFYINPSYKLKQSLNN